MTGNQRGKTDKRTSSTVGNNIKRYRKKANLTQPALVEKLKANSETIGSKSMLVLAEAGKRSITVDDLTALAFALKIPVIKLLYPNDGDQLAGTPNDTPDSISLSTILPINTDDPMIAAELHERIKKWRNKYYESAVHIKTLRQYEYSLNVLNQISITETSIENVLEFINNPKDKSQEAFRESLIKLDVVNSYREKIKNYQRNIYTFPEDIEFTIDELEWLKDDWIKNIENASPETAINMIYDPFLADLKNYNLLNDDRTSLSRSLETYRLKYKFKWGEPNITPYIFNIQKAGNLKDNPHLEKFFQTAGEIVSIIQATIDNLKNNVPPLETNIPRTTIDPISDKNILGEVEKMDIENLLSPKVPISPSISLS